MPDDDVVGDTAMGRQEALFNEQLPDPADASGVDARTTPDAFQPTISLVERRTGFELDRYLRSTLLRQLALRMTSLRIPDIASYRAFLAANESEALALGRSVVGNSPRFFQAPSTYELLRDDILPALLARCPKQDCFRAWVVGCSTGEDAYSIAVVLRECLDNLGEPRQVQVFATDVDRQAIAMARAGRFPRSIASDVEPRRLARFFVATHEEYQIQPDVRQLLVFGIHDMLTDAPLARIDLLLCRNHLTRLQGWAQARLLSFLQRAGQRSALLLVGEHEAVDPSTGFTRIRHGQPLFEFVGERVSPSASTPAPTSYPAAQDTTSLGRYVADLSRRVLADAYGPPGVVVDGEGTIQHIFGKTGAYLELPHREARFDARTMAKGSLKQAIHAGLSGVRTLRRTAVLEPVLVDSDGASRLVKVTLHPLGGAIANHGWILITFEDMTAEPPLGVRTGARRIHRVHRLERELRAALDGYEAADLELRRANDQLCACREELRSARVALTQSEEELSTSKAELRTVNAELQAKLDELADLNDDLRTVVQGSGFATILVDRHLTVRRFTQNVEVMLGPDVVATGRSLAEVASRASLGDLAAHAHRAVTAFETSELEAHPLEGQPLISRVVPQRTQDGIVKGAAILVALRDSRKDGRHGT